MRVERTMSAYGPSVSSHSMPSLRGMPASLMVGSLGGLHAADLVAQGGGVLEILRIDRALQAAAQRVDARFPAAVVRVRREGDLADVLRPAMQAAEEAAKVLLVVRVAGGAAEPPALLVLGRREAAGRTAA